MTTKQDNIDFFSELQSIKRKGIIAMIGTYGLRHTTLWNESNFVDVEFGYYNFLDKITLSKNYIFGIYYKEELYEKDSINNVCCCVFLCYE